MNKATINIHLSLLMLTLFGGPVADLVLASFTNRWCFLLPALWFGASLSLDSPICKVGRGRDWSKLESIHQFKGDNSLQVMIFLDVHARVVRSDLFPPRKCCLLIRKKNLHAIS